MARKEKNHIKTTKVQKIFLINFCNFCLELIKMTFGALVLGGIVSREFDTLYIVGIGCLITAVLSPILLAIISKYEENKEV